MRAVKQNHRVLALCARITFRFGWYYCCFCCCCRHVLGDQFYFRVNKMQCSKADEYNFIKLPATHTQALYFVTFTDDFASGGFRSLLLIVNTNFSWFIGQFFLYILFFFSSTSALKTLRMSIQKDGFLSRPFTSSK